MSDQSGGILPRKVKNEDADLDITPMIDITFLLLAFFVVVSKMDPTLAIVLPAAEQGEATPEKNCVVLVVRQGAGEGEVEIFKGRDAKTKVPDGEPIDMESDIAQYVEEELSRRPQVRVVLIKAEPEVKTGQVELVKRGIAGSELAADREIHIGVEDSN
ncbi:MAG: biopolymer transporter ExbD [Planctomycetota bacterium]